MYRINNLKDYEYQLNKFINKTRFILVYILQLPSKRNINARVNMKKTFYLVPYVLNA